MGDAIKKLHQSAAKTPEHKTAANDPIDTTAAIAQLNDDYIAAEAKLEEAYKSAKDARKVKFDETLLAKQDKDKTTLEDLEKTQAKEKDDAAKLLETEHQKVVANKKLDNENATKAEKERRDAESAVRLDSFDRKVRAAKQDMDLRVYVQNELSTANTNQNNVGTYVQNQVEGLAGAAKKVAETIHYLHQNRVDGLNNGVSAKIDQVDDELNIKIKGVQDNINEVKKDADEAILRNNVRAHALAQDIVDRHGPGQFEDNRVSTKFYEEAINEKDPTYQTSKKDKYSYREEQFPEPRRRSRRQLAANYVSMRPSERALERRRLMNRPKTHSVFLEALLKEVNAAN